MSVGRLPLGSGAGGAHDTPRAGGVPTTRSSGHGTPRDVQRVALGERPHEHCEQHLAQQASWVVNGSGGGPPLTSPQHTARSAALSSAAVSSEPWSWTSRASPRSSLSSSKDSLSSHSRLDSLVVGGTDDVCASMTAGRGGMANSNCSLHDANRAHLDLQRNLELMRFVISRENNKLRDLVQETHERLADISRMLEGGSSAAKLPETREPRRVEWRVRNLCSAITAALGGVANGTWQERKDFRLPEHPGLDFVLELQASLAPAITQSCTPSNGVHESDDALQPKLLLELSLEASGPARCEGPELHVALTIDFEGLADVGQKDCTESAEASLKPGSRGACCHCSVPLPPEIGAGTVMDLAVLCRAMVTPLHCLEDGPLQLRSSWEASDVVPLDVAPLERSFPPL